MSTSIERQQWLEAGRTFCVGLLASVDCNVPESVRVTIGWPSTGGRGKRIGECWDAVASTDGHFEVFISPRLTDSVTILATLLHELIHAAVGSKHGKAFKRPAVAAGLEGKMTATVPGEALKATFQQWIKANGPYPAGGLNLTERKKQSTRMLKCACDECGYTVRTAAKWLAEYGPPQCPNPEHEGRVMVADVPEDDEGEPESPPPPPPAPKPPRKPKPAPEPPKAPETKPAPKPSTRKARGKAKAEPAPKPEGVVTFTVETPDDPAWGKFGTDVKAAKVAARKASKEGERIAAVIAWRNHEAVGRYHFAGGLFGHTSGEFPW